MAEEKNRWEITMKFHQWVYEEDIHCIALGVPIGNNFAF